MRIRTVGAVLGGAIVLAGAVAVISSASTPEPAIETVVPAAGYASATVELAVPLYSTATVPADDGDPEVAQQPLDADSFTLRGAAGVTITTVTRDGDERYSLTFSAPVTPNATEIVLAAGSVYTGSDDLVVAELSHVVPLTGADAAARLAGLAELELDLRAFGPVPFVGGWFVNEQLVDGSTDYTAQMAAMADGQTPRVEGPLPADAAVEYQSQPRTLSHLVEDLDALALGSLTSQAEVAEAVAAVDGIASVTFTATQAQISFDDAVAAADSSVEQVTDVPSLPFALHASSAFDLHLDGSLTLDLTDLVDGAAQLESLSLGMAPRDVVVDTLGARIGMVSVTPQVTARTSGLRAQLACTAGCATPMPTIAGTAALELTGVGYDAGGTLGTRTVDLRSGGNPLAVSWNTGSWNLAALAALETEVGAEALLAPLQPTVTNTGAFAAANLARFGQLDTRAFVLGMEWIASWLMSIDDLGAFGTQMPVVGMTVGDVLALSDQVGSEVSALIATIEGDGTSPAPSDPSAQELVRILCASSLMDCEVDAASPWGYELDGLTITPDGITYDVEFEVCQVLFGADASCTDAAAARSVAVTESGPGLDLQMTDLLAGSDGAETTLVSTDGEAVDLGPLGGMNVSLRTGSWQGTASASLAFRVGLDLRPDATVMSSLGITEDDFPGTGNPTTDTLEAGDMCRGLALGILPGSSPTAFASANGQLKDAEFEPACDLLAWNTGGGSFRSVQIPPVEVFAEEGATTEPVQPGPTSHLVTAEEVCRGAAYKHAVDLGDFLAWNGFGSGDLASQYAACAARAYAQLTGVQGTPPFVYEPDRTGQPLPIGYRISVEQLDAATPFASAAVDVRSADGAPAGSPAVSPRFGGEARLGFLDLGFTGSVVATPAVTMRLAGEGARLTLDDLATSADAGDLSALVETGLSGSLAVDLELTNAIAFPASSPARIEVQGQLADLTDPDFTSDQVVVTEDCVQLTGATTGVCYSFGDWSKLRQLSPAQTIRMVTGLLDRLAGAANAGDASFELPVLGVSVQDLVAFNRKLNTIATTVEALDPQDLTALQAAIDAGLESAGLPTGSVVADVTGAGVFTLAIPLTYSETASYPFNFDVGLGDALPIRISPADGGARVSATGTASFTPTLGIDLAAPTTTPLDERVFLVTSPATDPTITGSLDADVAGAVTLGPIGVDLSATATGNPSATLELSSLGTAGRLTLDDLTTAIEDGLPSGFVTWGGSFTVDGAIAGPTGPLELGWGASLQELLNGGSGMFSHDPGEWDLSGIQLDLGTLVRGTAQTSRFVGRSLSRSDALSTSLPLVGDELAKLSQVGADLQLFARTVDELWEDVEQADNAFVSEINSTLATEVCGPLSPAGTCTAELEVWSNGVRQPLGQEQLTGADEVKLTLDLALEYDRTLDTPKLIDVPGFELDTQAQLGVKAGYRLGLTLGLDMVDGFYVQGFEVTDDEDSELSRLLEVYGRAALGPAAIEGGEESTVNAVGSKPGMKVGGVTVFTLEELDLQLGGSFGPKGDSAGFALDMPSKLTLSDITSRRRPIDSIFEPRISVNTSSVITVQTPDDIAAELPVFRFPIHFRWAMEGVIGQGLELESPYLAIGDRATVSYVAIDASGLLDGVVRPTLLELNKYNPVAKAKPVRDALNTEIPVLEQNVRSMLELGLGNEPSWQLFTFLLDMGEVADSLQDSPPGGFIQLGGYQMLPRDDEAGFFNPPGMDSLWDLAHTGEGGLPEMVLVKNVMTSLSKMAGGGTTFTPPAPRTPPEPGSFNGDLGGSSGFSGAVQKPKGASLGQVVSFPVLDDPLSAATLLFGNEAAPVSFIEIAPPAVDFGYNVKFSRTLFDLNVGFLEAKLSVGLEGAVGVVLRVGMGYSSHGLTTGNPVNGLYLVDAYDGNRDLPFIALGGRVSASVDGRFAVAGIAEATFRGSGYVRLEGGLDLFDESLTIPAAGRGDGKFHVDEMARVVKGHRIGGGGAAPSIADAFCIFRPVVQLDAGLAFGGSARVAGIKVWSGSWKQDWELVNETFSCPMAYRLAHLDGRKLVLNAGPYAGERFDGLGDIAEGFTLTQVTRGGVPHIRVVGSTSPLSNATAYEPMEFPVAAVEEIVADLGAGNDSVDISTDITTPAVVFGGPGNDTILGGGGDDLLDAGSGKDTIQARAGDNEIVIGTDGVGSSIDLTAGDGLGVCAGTACNTVVLGSGDDLVLGGPAAVVYRPPATGPFGTNIIDHDGASPDGATLDGPAPAAVSTAILDLQPAATGFTGVLDGLGGRFESLDAAGVSLGVIEVEEPQSIARLLGSAGPDRFRIVDGPLGMYVDGAAGVDHITVETNGNDRTVRVTDTGTAGQDTLLVRGTTGPDRILMRALRAVEPTEAELTAAKRTRETIGADRGLVAVLDRGSSTTVADHDLGRPGPATGQDPADVDSQQYTGEADATQLVYYDSSIGTLEVDGVAGANEIALDDVATTTVVDAGRGTGRLMDGNRIQIGQIFGWYDDEFLTEFDGAEVAPYRSPLKPGHPVAEDTPDPWTNGFRFRESIRGWLSLGVSHPTTVKGGEANDRFTVYSNVAPLTLEGTGGDNTFTLRAFIANGSITATGGEGNDTFNYDFQYVANDEVSIDGGGGFNTFVAIGTELQDGFIVTEDGVSVCVPRASAPGVAELDGRITQKPGVFALPEQPDPDAVLGATGDCGIDATAENVQRYVLYGLEGNNVFWVKGAPAGTETYLIGGAHGSTYLFGDEGDLSAIQGTVEVVADLLNLSSNAEEALRSVELDFPLPILLDGEVAYSPVAALIPADAVDTTAEHTAHVDASAMSGQDGTLASDRDGLDDDAPGVRLDGLSTGVAGEFDLVELDRDDQLRTYEVAGGVGFRGLDLLRVVLGSDDDTLTVEDTHGHYELEVAVPDPVEEPDTYDQALAAMAAARDGDGDGGAPLVSERAGRSEFFVGGGDDALQLAAISGPTWVWLEDGDNAVRIGDGQASGITDELEIYGGAGDDDVEVDASDGPGALRADLDLFRDETRTVDNHDPDIPAVTRTLHLAELTRLGMTGLVRHDAAVEILRIVTGDSADVVNVRGSLATEHTQLVTGDGDDRVLVSDVTDLSPGEPTPGLLLGHLRDVEGDVDLLAGAGDNLLMVSRRDDTEGVVDGRVTPDTIAGFAGLPGDDASTITYDADGTFARGVTVWTGEGEDVVDVTGVRSDGDPTTLAWQDRDDSGDPIRTTTTTLNVGDGADDVTVDVRDGDGLLVVNLEEGDDQLDGSASTLGFVAFGGDGADRIISGAGDDLVFGDWGRAEFRDGDGGLVDVWGVPDRMDLTDGLARESSVIATCVAQPAVQGGAVGGCEDEAADVEHGREHAGLLVPGITVRNWISVGAGDDVAFGGGGRDWIEATDGINALVGDHGQVWRVTTEELGGEREVATNGPFVDELVLDGPFAYRVDIHDARGGDTDVLLGGADRDWIFGGPGDDLANGGGGRDVLWGGDGHDVLWGGVGDDRIYGGAGDDVVDVKLRSDGTWPTGSWWSGRPLVPASGWALVAPDVDTDRSAASHNDNDLVFGGTGQDTMQADVGSAGTVPGDRMFDWYGAHNAYLVCEGAYGAGYVLRSPAPATIAMLRELAMVDGAIGIGTAGTSGERQLAMIGSGNRSPNHPLHPANNADCGAAAPADGGGGGNDGNNGKGKDR